MSILRIIPVKSLQEIWNFPAIYTNAEVSLVTVAGGYVIESPSMEGNDYLDYISTYNFDHNEEKENQLKEKLFNNEVLSFHYKNAKNEKCYWYYSVFEQNGIHTQRACNGKESVDVLENSEEHAFDLVFMDIQMPIMNGYEATKVIRASKRKDIQTIPVVAMSADAFAEMLKLA